MQLSLQNTKLCLRIIMNHVVKNVRKINEVFMKFSKIDALIFS